MVTSSIGTQQACGTSYGGFSITKLPSPATETKLNHTVGIPQTAATPGARSQEPVVTFIQTNLATCTQNICQ